MEARQDSLERVLDISLRPGSNECSVNLSDHPCFGHSNGGGYSVAVAQKAATLYASQHAQLKKHRDVRFSSSTLFRPIFPSKGPLTVRVHEVNTSRIWSMLRVEAFQGSDITKLCLSAEFMLMDFSVPGVDLQTGWKIHPVPTPVNLRQLEDHQDPNWICYHTAFHPRGFRRGHSYIKNFVPSSNSTPNSYNEQWILPGWDCTGYGSRDSSVPEGRWTNETIPFAADMQFPMQENFFPKETTDPLSIGSMAAARAFGIAQKKARDEGRTNWRQMSADGSGPDGLKVFLAQGNMTSGTLNMTVELKKKLPPEGVRWLYMRTEVRTISADRYDLQTLLFDEHMDLVAIRNGVEQLLPAAAKQERKPKI